MNSECRRPVYRRSTGTFIIRVSRASLETLYIRQGVLDVQIHSDNHVLAGTRAPRYPATSFATASGLPWSIELRAHTETTSCDHTLRIDALRDGLHRCVVKTAQKAYTAAVI